MDHSLQKIVALVPMRHVSVRVPGKNYRPLAGKPLFHYILEALAAVPAIAQVVVDTDSPEVSAGIARHFPDVLVLERPEHLRADTVPMNEVLLHDTGQVAADAYLQTHSTNPLLTPETIARAIAAFQQGYPAYDSLFSVTRLQSRLWDGLARPINHNPEILLRTQDLPPVYEENSCLYIFTRENLAARRNRIGVRPLLFEIDRREALDIDDEVDFQLAELMVKGKG